ncbi:hypothetical protein SCLCIDRAFT_1223260 [Scleroderma citrinum Foug A]|uniref:Uncharacterized protein n=1 Tax=Scleroderma citrinum Foug A TaxID=1036808 RepID=A0A0C2YTK6_9AGAM|nr:hypothetical protein SCLCIDRAFT_1223260 [Scleroderma citrinum Foug A]
MCDVESYVDMPPGPGRMLQTNADGPRSQVHKSPYRRHLLDAFKPKSSKTVVRSRLSSAHTCSIGASTDSMRLSQSLDFLE